MNRLKLILIQLGLRLLPGKVFINAVKKISPSELFVKALVHPINLERIGLQIKSDKWMFLSLLSKIIRRGRGDLAHMLITKGALLKHFSVDLQAALLFIDAKIKNADQRLSFVPGFRNEKDCVLFTKFLRSIKEDELALEIIDNSKCDKTKLSHSVIGGAIYSSENVSVSDLIKLREYRFAYCKWKEKGIDIPINEQVDLLFNCGQFETLSRYDEGLGEKVKIARRLINFKKEDEIKYQSVKYHDLTLFDNQKDKLPELLKLLDGMNNYETLHVIYVNKYVNYPLPNCNFIFHVEDLRFTKKEN